MFLPNLMISTSIELTKFNKRHPHSCKQRVTLQQQQEPMEDGVQHSFNNYIQIINLRTYFSKKKKKKKTELNTTLDKAIIQADKGITYLNLYEQNRLIPKQTIEGTITLWNRNSYTWLRKGELQTETEPKSFIMAIQDQVIATRNYCK